MKQKRIYNLSYDIPENVKGKNEKNTLDRHELVKFLMKERVIDLNGTFSIYHEGKEYKKVRIAYLVKTTLIFYSYFTKEEIGAALSKQFKSQLYYVLTEIKTDENEPYFANNLEEEDLQDGFAKEVEAIEQEIKDEQRNKIIDIIGYKQ